MFFDEGTKVEKRNFKRVSFRDAVKYHLKNEGSFGGCLAYDISEGGLKMNFNDFVPPQSEMVLQMRLRNINKVVDLTGRVAWTQQMPYSDRFQLGVEFTKVDPVAQEELRTYVQSRRF